MRKFSVLIIFAVFGSLFLAAPAQASFADGSVRVFKTDYKKVGSYHCFQMSGKWIPGEWINQRAGRAISLKQLASNSQNKMYSSTGSKRTKFKKQRDGYLAKNKIQSRACSRAMNTVAFKPQHKRVTGTSTCRPNSVSASQGVKLNLSCSIGLALKANVNTIRSIKVSGGIRKVLTTSTNLFTYNSDGSIVPVVESGTAIVQHFLVASDGNIYAQVQPTNVCDAEGACIPTCIFIKVTKVSGDTNCIDPSLQSMNWNSEVSPVQFDSAGGIYYFAQSANGSNVIRRKLNGSFSDVVHTLSGKTLQDFAVFPNGGVLVNMGGLKYFRPNGSIASVSTASPQFMRMFPDGKAYVGMWQGGRLMGVLRFDPSIKDTGFEDKFWISGGTNGVSRTAYYNVDDLNCTGDTDIAFALCGSYGTWVSGGMIRQGNAIYMIPNVGPVSALVRYYPDVSIPDIPLIKVTVAAPAGQGIVVTGSNSDEHYATYFYDTSANQVQTLISVSDETEVYHLSYRAATNTVIYDGVRYSDGSYVVGTFDLNTGSKSVNVQTGDRLVDLQAIS